MKRFVLALKVALREHHLTRGAYARLGVLASLAWLALWRAKTGRSFPAHYFDKLYAKQEDPWSYRGSGLSERRRDTILGTLPRARYPSLLEIGCGEGWMSPMLASRADRFFGVDISSNALARARDVCAPLANAHLFRLDIVEDNIVGQFDAIVCAGVLVFVAPAAQISVRDKVIAALRPGAELLLENHLGEYPGQMPGPNIHASFARHPGLTLMSYDVGEGYCVSLFRKKPN